jgi:hypothetical protein
MDTLGMSLYPTAAYMRIRGDVAYNKLPKKLINGVKRSFKNK